MVQPNAILPVLVNAFGHTMVKSSKSELSTVMRLKWYNERDGLPHGPLFENSNKKESHYD